MRWIAPTEKDTANETLEQRLRAAAHQFRVSSGLKAGQYSTPVLGASSGAMLVTNNEKHFRRVEGLKVENWA